jgi:hypothetical protein
MMSASDEADIEHGDAGAANDRFGSEADINDAVS